MKFLILASGSKGNSSLIINDNGDLLLIDVGISYKEICEKINRYGYDENKVKDVLITHEHDDHIKSIKSFCNAKKYSLSSIKIATEYLEKYESRNINNFIVTAIPLSHDVNCCGYVIEADNQRLVYITDTGYIKEKNKEYIKNADYYIFESNHNVKMLMETNRPSYLKSRILGDEGHLSNEDASNILCDVIGDKTKQIYLAHLSREANTKETALNTFKMIAEERNVNLKNIFINAADQNVELIGGKEYEKNSINN